MFSPRTCLTARQASPAQLVVITLIESLVFQLNRKLLAEGKFHFTDTGGTIIIHMFGAYFGLAVAYVLGKKPDMSKEASSKVSDILSLIGTITLWVYWPSFVGGSLTSGTSESELALTNTMTSLIGSTLITFALSALYNGKVRPVDIQNATLAGGVAIGATANLDISPSVALAIGFGAGTISCVGYNRVQDWLHEKVGLGNRNFTASNPRFHHH